MIPLYFVHYALLLVFGILLSFSFCGLRPTRKNLLIGTGLFIFCGALQLLILFFSSEKQVWYSYPFSTHLPLWLCLVHVFRKRPSQALLSVTTAYLCCQIPKWFGLLALSLNDSEIMGLLVRILLLVLCSLLITVFLGPILFKLYSQTALWGFGILPTTFYFFDYSSSIYADFWPETAQVISEFLPLVLCLAHFLFCFMYNLQYEKTMESEQRESLLGFVIRQRSKDFEAVRRSEQEVRLLRHDLRHLLNLVSMRLEAGDVTEAQKLLTDYTQVLDSTVIHRYCSNETLNYILSDYTERSRKANVALKITVLLSDTPLPDDILLGSILSNVLENALQAQAELPEDRRSIDLLLRHSNGKLLISCKNPYGTKPVLVGGFPVIQDRAHSEGHGYGTRSIYYITQRLGGNCRFSLKDDLFAVYIVI